VEVRLQEIKVERAEVGVVTEAVMGMTKGEGTVEESCERVRVTQPPPTAQGCTPSMEEGVTTASALVHWSWSFSPEEGNTGRVNEKVALK